MNSTISLRSVRSEDFERFELLSTEDNMKIAQVGGGAKTQRRERVCGTEREREREREKEREKERERERERDRDRERERKKERKKEREGG